MGQHGDSWMTASKTFFTSESVTEGHPDKVCDQISDAVLDAVLRRDPEAHVACETATTTGMILVFGEISTEAYVEIPAIVRETVANIGYTHSSHGFDAKTCGVIVAIKDQSPEISTGIATTIEMRAGAAKDRFDEIGAGGEIVLVDGFDQLGGEEIGEVIRLPRKTPLGKARPVCAVAKEDILFQRFGKPHSFKLYLSGVKGLRDAHNLWEPRSYAFQGKSGPQGSTRTLPAHPPCR